MMTRRRRILAASEDRRARAIIRASLYQLGVLLDLFSECKIDDATVGSNLLEPISLPIFFALISSSKEIVVDKYIF